MDFLKAPPRLLERGYPSSNLRPLMEQDLWPDLCSFAFYESLSAGVKGIKFGWAKSPGRNGYGMN